jgi:AcrR family transcriptional regulator
MDALGDPTGNAVTSKTPAPPKTWAKRGAHLLDALVEIVADRGLDAVSIRTVASAAGVSVAQVQYYFRSKDQLLAAAFEHVSEGFERRARDVDTTGRPRDVLRRLLHLWLPLDEKRSRDARVWTAFTAAAATSAVLRPINAAVDRDLRAWIAGFLRSAQEAGDLSDSVDADVEASVLLAVVDGLVLQALVATDTERTALVVDGVDAHLSRLFAEPVTP